MDGLTTKELLSKEKINEFEKKKSTKMILSYKESAKSKNESCVLTVWCPEGKESYSLKLMFSPGLLHVRYITLANGGMLKIKIDCIITRLLQYLCTTGCWTQGSQDGNVMTFTLECLRAISAKSSLSPCDTKCILSSVPKEGNNKQTVYPRILVLRVLSTFAF